MSRRWSEHGEHLDPDGLHRLHAARPIPVNRSPRDPEDDDRAGRLVHCDDLAGRRVRRQEREVHLLLHRALPGGDVGRGGDRIRGVPPGHRVHRHHHPDVHVEQ